jgi:hypothetical protein
MLKMSTQNNRSGESSDSVWRELDSGPHNDASGTYTPNIHESDIGKSPYNSDMSDLPFESASTIKGAFVEVCCHSFANVTLFEEQATDGDDDDDDDGSRSSASVAKDSTSFTSCQEYRGYNGNKFDDDDADPDVAMIVEDPTENHSQHNSARAGYAESTPYHCPASGATGKYFIAWLSIELILVSSLEPTPPSACPNNWRLTASTAA